MAFFDFIKIHHNYQNFVGNFLPKAPFVLGRPKNGVIGESQKENYFVRLLQPRIVWLMKRIFSYLLARSLKQLEAKLELHRVLDLRY